MQQYEEMCRVVGSRADGFNDKQPWWNDKALRKQKWCEMGLDESYLVPTLFHTAISSSRTSLDMLSLCAPTRQAQIEEDPWNDGTTLESIYHTPEDANCEEEIQSVLQKHRSVVFKPTNGSDACGVMILSCVEESPDLDTVNLTLRVHSHTSTMQVSTSGGWLTAYQAWYTSTLYHPRLSQGFLVEQMVEWNNEVCVVDSIQPPVTSVASSYLHYSLYSPPFTLHLPSI